jgi:acyl-CoA reductase-like NAD-dependent aldehyde dehydrogenase
MGAGLAADGVGTGVDVGSMISRDRFRTLQDRIEAAESQGAQVDEGGKPHAHPYLNNGCFFEPTVIGDVRQDMDIAQQERKFSIHTEPQSVLMLPLYSVRSNSSCHAL